jgi:transposase InsO family protein
VLRVSPQGYKKHLKNLSRPYKYAQLLAAMGAILEEDVYNKTYGKQRMFEKLRLDYDCPHCYNTVAKVMRENGLMQKANSPKGLTRADKDAQKSDNLLNRDFTAEAPNEKTVTDITEMEASDGKLYISATFDCFDNVCLSVAMADHMRKELVVETVNRAAANYDLRGAISHSDRGSQYTSDDYRNALAGLGITQSMNSAAGRCHDNAMCESMWARSKHEITTCYDTKKTTREQLKTLVMDYFLNYWNYRRICSAIGGMPPLIRRGAHYEKQADKSAKPEHLQRTA